MPDAAAATLSGGRSYTVVFDGNCRVCTRLARGLFRLDRTRQLEIVPYQQSDVMARFPWIPEGAYSDALQLVAADGTTWQGAAAIEQLLSVLPRARWVSWIFRVPFARPLADRFYRWFARNRYRLTVCTCRPDPASACPLPGDDRGRQCGPPG